ncbi:Exo-endo-phos-2 multi-domain protein [Pyrenophora tritici-repentis]|uniref:Exo-endo-phos-2 multi-domain protein n=1 Tax=Pyrenophora tritici-repentis TaxID=45151 RepID=A0A922SPV1_9PLEO|nr:Exo-endo-phos-2 multi-domain protein [Pyrenophora tritici-repentis]
MISPVISWNNPTTWGTDRPRVLTYTRKSPNIRATLIHPRISRDVLWIEANGYRILNVYRQPQNDSTFQYLTALTPPRNCLVGGDLNARHELFEPGSTSANRGAEIARWATQNDIPYIGEAVIRGRAAGNRRIPRSKVQRVAQLLPATPRNVLASPHFSYGSRQDPTQGQGKDIAAQNFTIWWESLGQETITVFSDGSEQQINGTRVVTYGYAIYQGQAAVATGQGSLNALSHVFDAEAIGACRGLKHALQLSLPSQREIVLCIDSTSVIWGIRGAAPASSQWAFLQIHGAMEAYSVKTRWAPGHMKIVGNELADQLADNEAKDPHQPYGMAASPTRSGIRTVGRRLLEHTRDTWWKDKSSRLSAWYTQWQLPYDTRRTPAALWLPRRILAKVLMIRSTHGDFEWYHRKFNHEDTSKCLCGRPKTPEHLVFCKRATTHFKKWPLRPIVPPRTRQEGLAYLAQLIDQPQEFETFVKVTNSFYDE